MFAAMERECSVTFFLIKQRYDVKPLIHYCSKMLIHNVILLQVYKN